jgi:hypothetical protein
MSIPYEEVLDIVDHLPVEKRLQLIEDVSAHVRKELAAGQEANPSHQPRKTFADYYGIWRGAVFNDEDFAAAEWHPTEEELNGDD